MVSFVPEKPGSLWRRCVFVMDSGLVGCGTLGLWEGFGVYVGGLKLICLFWLEVDF